jgi:hypothetical protein
MTDNFRKQAATIRSADSRSRWARSLLTAGMTCLLLTTTATPAQSVTELETPDFGPDVVIVTPAMTVEQINAAIAPRPNDPRRQIFFMPGIYGSAAGAASPDTARDIVAANLNANTAMAGLGKSPEDVRINGALHIDVSGFAALVTFARSLSNLTINPIQPGLPPNTMRWQTSQTAHWRRVNLLGSLDVVGNPPTYAFGSVIANSRITGVVDVGDARITASSPGGKANAMYYVRDSVIGGWKGFASQMVFSGVEGAPADNFGPGGSDRSKAGDKVTLRTTPLSREAPFLYVEKGEYNVFVPKARRDSAGVNWSVRKDVGTSMPISRFLIARPSDPVEKLNEAIALGKDIILTPGVYQLTAPLRVARADAVVMGLGFAQLNAVNGTEAVIVADVPGVVLSGFGIGTGPKTSDVLVRIGTPGVRSGDATNPTTLSDVHIAGNAVTTEIIDQDHVLVDGAWIRTWRDGKIEWADAANSFGVVVNGNNVTWTGLWVEHFKKTQITWNGNGGRVVFLQNEPPYEPPSQAVWMNGDKPGYPSLKIADHVKSFRLDGFSTYTRFSNGCECFVWSAIETPISPTIRFHGLTAASILYPIPGGGFTRGGYKHIINDHGPAIDAGVDSGHSRLPHSDVFGFTANHRIASFPD